MKNRLDQLRKAKGIRQEQLADALRVSRQTINHLFAKMARHKGIRCYSTDAHNE